MKVANIRKKLPENALSKFDDITLPRVLGASKHIRLIYQIIIDILTSELEYDQKLLLVEELIVFFIETRGKSSVAITNQLNALQNRLFQHFKYTVPEAIEFIKQEEEKLKSSIDNIVKYSINLSKSMNKILVYDYSSTVEEFLKELPLDVEVVVPESRSLNGGAPFIKSLIETNHKVKFIVDAAIYNELKDCDAVFIGAETFCFDGSTYNTIGSDLVAYLCKMSRIPFYVLTPTNKIFVNSLYGETRQIIVKNLKSKLGYLFEEKLVEKINFENVELVKIPGNYITLYITEYGVSSPFDLHCFLRHYQPDYFREED